MRLTLWTLALHADALHADAELLDSTDSSAEELGKQKKHVDLYLKIRDDLNHGYELLGGFQDLAHRSVGGAQGC